MADARPAAAGGGGGGGGDGDRTEARLIAPLSSLPSLLDNRTIDLDSEDLEEDD